jgi:hypothetical protein
MIKYKLSEKQFKFKVILTGSLTNLGAGGKFLHSLLDNHPDILTIPHAPQVFCDVRKFKIKSKKDILKELENFKEFFNSKYDQVRGRHKLGKKKNIQIKINKKKFFFHLNKFLNENKWSLKNYILSVYLSYTLTIKKKITKKKFIVIYLHDMFFLEIFQKLFPKSIILASVRLPINSFATYTRNKKIKADRTKSIINGEYLHWLYSIFKFKDIKSKIYCMNIEELHKNPKLSILKLCSKINLKFHNSLLTSTFNGKLWFNPRKFSYNGFNFKYHNKINYDEVNKDVYDLIDFSTVNFQTYLGYVQTDLKVDKIKFPTKSFLKYFIYIIFFFFFKSKQKSLISFYNLLNIKLKELKYFDLKIDNIKKYDLSNKFRKQLILINKNTHKFERK